jgi:hypothetical protein
LKLDVTDFNEKSDGEKRRKTKCPCKKQKRMHLPENRWTGERGGGSRASLPSPRLISGKSPFRLQASDGAYTYSCKPYHFADVTFYIADTHTQERDAVFLFLFLLELAHPSKKKAKRRVFVVFHPSRPPTHTQTHSRST